MPKFVEFPKIARLRRECVITEKLDGTNAAVHIVQGEPDTPNFVARVDGFTLYAQSRNRFIVPGSDNYGFAAWVRDNASELVKLGPGCHFGEWWGKGVQRGYGLMERRFSLFNTARWKPDNLPACCHVVPVLYAGKFSTDVVESVLDELRKNGSWAAPGFKSPEGVVVYLPAARQLFKVTLEHDDVPKSALKEAA